MNNKITASIRFCFKGQTHEPTLELDLDEFMKRSAQFSEIYMLLARANDFDLYSYEYEMMQAEPITIVQASGLVSDYVIDGLLDEQGFEQAWKESIVNNGLVSIAKNILSIDNLDNEPDIKQALIEAYNLGCSVK